MGVGFLLFWPGSEASLAGFGAGLYRPAWRYALELMFGFTMLLNAAAMSVGHFMFGTAKLIGPTRAAPPTLKAPAYR